MSNPFLKAALLFVILLAMVSLSMAQTTSNYIFVESVFFNGERYDLAWSSNPLENYYKQEYLRSKDNLQNFNKMILIEVMAGNTSLLGLPLVGVVTDQQTELPNDVYWSRILHGHLP